MALINQPPTTACDQQDDKLRLIAPAEGWRNFFMSAYNICNALTMSGTTANRPTSLLWVGRMYFDTTLTRPIWYTGSNWIRADGVVV